MKPENANGSGPLNNSVLMQSDRERSFVLSPVRLMSTLLLCVFIVETLVMLVLENKEPVGWKETLIDSSVLTSTLFVILYFSLFKPLEGLINDYKRNKTELEERQEHLEQVIHECAVSEAELQETKAILQAAMDQSPAGIAIADAPDGVLRYVNDAGLLIRGADRQVAGDGIGIDQYVDCWQVFGFDGLPLHDDEIPLTRALKFGETCSREFIIRRSDNVDRIVLVNAAPIRNENNEVVAGIAVFWDITERKQVEDELKVYQNHLERLVEERSRDLEETTRRLKLENEKHIKAKAALLETEERFRQIFEQSEDAIVLLDPGDGTVIDLNPIAEHMFHQSKSEILANGLQALCNPEGYQRLAVVFRQIARDDIPGMIEKLECTTASGEVRILSFRGKKITLQGVGVVYTTFRDITARIRMEEEAREIQAHLIHANRMTTLGTMVSSVAHEINNPNNFLLMNTDIIKRVWNDIVPVIDESYRINGDFAVGQTTWSEARTFLPEAIEGIQQGATRISSIVGTLKAFGRDERLTSEAVADVNQVVQLSAAILNQQISRSTHRFQMELADDLPPVKGVARQLEQVVINLIQNALQALPDPERGVQVTTGTDPDSGDVLIRVTDQGNGIPPEIAARIMEPFFTTRLEQGGTGLGLAISGTIVKEHGGQIEFSTEPGQGSTFAVRLCPAVPKEHTSQPSEAKHVNC